MAIAILIVGVACALAFIWLAFDLHEARKHDDPYDDSSDD